MLFQDPGMSGRFMKQVRPQWPLNRTTKVVLDIKNALPELWSRSCGYIKCLYYLGLQWTDGRYTSRDY